MKLRKKVFEIFAIIYIVIFILSIIFLYLESQLLNYWLVSGPWLIGGILNSLYDRVKKKNKIIGGIILASPFILFILGYII